MQLVKGKDLIIYDDILDKKWLFHLDNELDNSESWGFNCSGGLRTGYPPKPLYRFWGITLFKPTDEHIPFINNTHEGLINELFKFLDHFTQEHFPEEKFLPHILHCNGQTIGQDGDAHQDMTIKNGKDCNYT